MWTNQHHPRPIRTSIRDPIAVVVELQNGGPWDQSPNRVFDAWVEENHSPVQRISGFEAGRESKIYLQSRVEIAAAP